MTTAHSFSIAAEEKTRKAGKIAKDFKTAVEDAEAARAN